MSLENRDLEDELRRALRKQDPSPGFAARVIRRVEERRKARQARAWLAVAATLVIAALVPAAVDRYEAHRQLTARKAGRDLAIALNIAGHKLQTAQRLLHRRVVGV